MSDIPPPAPGWRQGPDGKWYGPDSEIPTSDGPEPALEASPDPAGAGEPTSLTGSGDDGDDGTKNRRMLIAGGVLVALIVIGAVAFSASQRGGDGLTLTGAFTLSDTESVSGTAEACSGTGGYSDFGPGMNVTIRNGSGAIIASANTTSLDADERFGSEEETETEDGDEPMSPKELADSMFEFLGCTVVFEVDVPSEEFYEIEVGKRGELSYSRQELEEKDWDVSLTLGD